MRRPVDGEEGGGAGPCLSNYQLLRLWGRNEVMNVICNANTNEYI